MEIYGNINSLKKAIEKKYEDQINQIEEETASVIKQLKTEANNKIALKRSRIATLTDSEIKKATSKITSEENLKAKKEFEQKREEMINEIFSMALKKASSVVHSKPYIDFLKKNMPKKKYELLADSSFYKKHLPKIKVTTDPAIIGVKLKGREVTYDFTLDGAIKSQEDVLRNKVSNILFS